MNAHPGIGPGAPTTHHGIVDPLPLALRPLADRKHWVVWRWELNDKGNWTKVPKQSGRAQYNAKNNDPATWSVYATAIAEFTSIFKTVDGIGFMLLDSDVAALDLDKCRNRETGEINLWAQELVDKASLLGAYVEVTPSGTGLRIIGKGQGEPVHRKFASGQSSIELYRKCTRYITISGAEIGTSSPDLPSIDALIAELLALHDNKRDGQESKANGGGEYHGSFDEDTIPAALMKLIRDGVEDGLRSEQFFRVVAQLKRLCWTIDGIAALLEHHPNGIAAKYTGRTREEVERVYAKVQEEALVAEGVSLDDFHAYMPTHTYIYAPSREMWPAASVNARISPVPVFDADRRPVLDKAGNQKTMPASAWLDQNKSVEQMTWAPGLPPLIRDRLISEGGWIERKGVATFNLHRPPTIQPGDATKAGPWLDHVRKVYGDQAEHIIMWLAHRVQRPQEKINHALVFGGSQGIGKDTLLEPVKQAVGPWNFSEISPQHMLGRFNGFLRSVILRVNEARDLGDVNRFQFYDHMKAYTAAPPDVLRVDEKNLREHSVLNCCGVIITTNHKTDGIYLPADDRRHFVAWSDLTKGDFVQGYWNTLWGWYASGGNRHVAAYLAELDISSFDPKAPPPKTSSFWEIVDANRAPEDAELMDVLDRLENPDAITITGIANASKGDFAMWITDRKNRRAIPHRLEKCGYVQVRNDGAKDGLWKINGARQAVYAKSTMSIRDRFKGASDLAKINSSIAK